MNIQPKKTKDAKPKHNATQLNASAASWVGSTGSGERVALQTALAKVTEKEERKITFPLQGVSTQWAYLRRQQFSQVEEPNEEARKEP